MTGNLGVTCFAGFAGYQPKEMKLTIEQFI